MLKCVQNSFHLTRQRKRLCRIFICAVVPNRRGKAIQNNISEQLCMKSPSNRDRIAILVAFITILTTTFAYSDETNAIATQTHASDCRTTLRPMQNAAQTDGSLPELSPKD